MSTHIADDTLLPDIRRELMKLDPFEAAHAQLVRRIDLELSLGDRLEICEEEDHARQNGRRPATARFSLSSLDKMLLQARSTCLMWGIPEDKVDCTIYTRRNKKGKQVFHAYGGLLSAVLKSNGIARLSIKIQTQDGKEVAP